MPQKLPLILASESADRLQLLANIKITPDVICPANIDETPFKQEQPHKLALRLAEAKAIKVASVQKEGYILAADTVTACGRFILPKAMTDEDVELCMRKLSGRRYQIHSGICVVRVENGAVTGISSKIVSTRIKFKCLAEGEIAEYIASGDGIGKSGGLSIESMAAAFTLHINGSYSNIIGLPLYETKNMLIGMGWVN